MSSSEFYSENTSKHQPFYLVLIVILADELEVFRDKVLSPLHICHNNKDIEGKTSTKCIRLVPFC